MRPYNETITWLRFRLELRHAPPSFWLLLGECAGALRHLSGTPLPSVEARVLERDLLAKSINGRLTMDGLNVSQEQVIQQLRTRTIPALTSNSGAAETEALLATWQSVRSEHPAHTTLTPESLQSLHGQLVSGTTEEGTAGTWRLHPVGPVLTDGVPPVVIGLFVEELCDWMAGPGLRAPTAEETLAYGLLRMLVTELYLAWIHPFPTAHGRLLGSVAQSILAMDGLSSVAGHLASIHFHRHGREYHTQITQAAEGAADPIPFLAFGLRGIAEGARELHARVRDLQVNGQWRAQLLDLFNNAEDGPTRRQRQLLLDLGDRDLPVPLNELTDLSTPLAKLYAGVSEKTLRRDVDALTAVGVLRRSPEGLRVERGNLLAFKY